MAVDHRSRRLPGRLDHWEVAMTWLQEAWEHIREQLVDLLKRLEDWLTVHQGGDR